MKAIASILTAAISMLTIFSSSNISAVDAVTNSNTKVFEQSVTSISEGNWKFDTKVEAFSNGLITVDIYCTNDTNSYCGVIGDITVNSDSIAEMYHDGASGRSNFDHVGCTFSNYKMSKDENNTTYTVSFDNSGEGMHYGGNTLAKLYLYTTRDYLSENQTISVFNNEIDISFDNTFYTRDELSAKVTELEDQIINYQKQIDEYQKQIDEYKKQIDDLKSQINNKNFSIAINKTAIKEPEYILGDANNDKNVNISDAVVLQKWLLADNTKIDYWQYVDMNQDNVLDTFDLCLLKNKLISKHSV